MRSTPPATTSSRAAAPRTPRASSRGRGCPPTPSRRPRTTSTHAYAATYTDPSNGHVLLFAGLDRFDNSGDATAGFWFFQNPISEHGQRLSGSTHFTGTHADGDILLVSDFSIGGSVSTIKVFRWTGNDATGSLVPVTAPGTTTFAIVNSGSIAVPWSFTDKSHHTSPAAGEFLEEGVDLTALGLGGCFSNFMAETRSSQSPTATLSDFVIGNFNTCTLLLPNTATVQADGIPPITSNEVVITVNDGDAMQATAVGGGAMTVGPAAAPLQSASVASPTPTSASSTAGSDSGTTLSAAAVDQLMASEEPSIFFLPSDDGGLSNPLLKRKSAWVV